MERVYNFSAGPAALPQEVLVQAQEEMLNWQGCGMSVMEMTHRGQEFMEIVAQAERDLRDLLQIPTNYKVLFLQGGASSQFTMVPMNLLRGKRCADYVSTGQWSEKAIREAQRYCTVNVAASAEADDFRSIPPQTQWRLDPRAAYVHYTPNETIDGVEFNWVPDTDGVPLVADMSSNILSRPVAMSSYGLVYAGAQKNIGSAGLTIVVVRDDLLGEVLPGTPTLFDYRVHANNASMYNTPPTYAIYIAGLVFKWLKHLGGIAEIERRNIEKAARLYAVIDDSDFYHCSTAKADRSRMNVPFTLKNAALDEVFLKQAKSCGLVQLKGHRVVGGMRASIYNAMPSNGVNALIDFMLEFEKTHD